MFLPPLTVGKVVGVATMILSVVYAILLIANLRPLKNKDNEFINQCPWQFPKIISCVLGARENLAGGLIGTGGAIFAAWFAWVTFRRQIDLQAVHTAIQDDRRLVDRVHTELRLVSDLAERIREGAYPDYQRTFWLVFVEERAAAVHELRIAFDQPGRQEWGSEAARTSRRDLINRLSDLRGAISRVGYRIRLVVAQEQTAADAVNSIIETVDPMENEISRVREAAELFTTHISDLDRRIARLLEREIDAATRETT